MKRLLFFVALTAITLLPGTLLWAAPVIDSVASNATHLEINVSTPVTVTAVITDPNYLQGSANLQRRGTNGTWTVLGTLQNIGGGQYRIARTFTEPAGGTMRLRISAAFRGVLKRALSPEILLPVGVTVQPSASEQIIAGPVGTGVALTVPPSALTEPALISIAPIPASDFPAPTGTLPVIATFNLIVRPLDSSGGDTPLLTKPIQVSIPAPAGTAPGDRFYIVQPLFTGSEQKLLATDTATVVGGQIVTESTTLAGTFGGGPTRVLEGVGSGSVEGVVNFGERGPRPGAMVSNSTNDFVFLADAQGRYKLPISGNPPATFSVTAQDQCLQATANGGTIPINNQTSTGVNITLPAPTSEAIIPTTVTGSTDVGPGGDHLRVGIGNAGFERSTSGCEQGRVLSPGQAQNFFIAEFGLSSSEISGFDEPDSLEGTLMALFGCFHVDDCGVGNNGFISKKFRVPSGVTELRFNFNFHCVSFAPSGPGDPSGTAQSCFDLPPGDPRQDDLLLVEIFDQNGLLIEDLPDRGFLGSIASTPLPGTTWREGRLNVTGLAGQSVTLTFSFFNMENNSAAFASTDIHVDNIRFGTVLVDVKIVEGAMADLPDNFTRFERVRQQVRDTNDILAQAGLNVRIRNIQTIPDPGNLLETDMTAVAIDLVSGKPEVPSEVAQLLALSRSGVSTDVNVYYVGALKKGPNTTNTFGLAAGPDDYHMSDPATQRGLIIRNLFGADLTLSTTDRQDKFREVLSHELGHLLIHGVQAEDNLEHSADSGNVMSGNRCTPPPPVPDPLTPAAPCSARALMTPAQSTIINQNGSGMIVP